MASGNAERNLAMVELYATGETLAAIGDKFGVTRERVRQILGKQGAVTADDARRVRREARAAEMSDSVNTFLTEYGEVLAGLAGAGIPRAEVEARFSLLVPSVAPGLVREGLRRAGYLFNVDVQEFIFPKAVIEGAVWYALARELELPVDRVAAVRQVNLSDAADLSEALQNEGIDAATIAAILLTVEAARNYVASNPGVGISAQRYNSQRSTIQVELGLESRKGNSPWPPTSQTVMKRLGAGAWADALVHMGLSPDRSRGRQRGLLVYTEGQYVEALTNFLNFAAESGQPSSFDMYGQWVEQEERAGRTWPAPASVRLRFGNWTNAKREAISVPALGQVQPVKKARVASNATASLHWSQSEIARLFEALSKTATALARPVIEEFLRKFAQDFEFRRRGWLREIVESDSTAAARQLSGDILTKKQRQALEASPHDTSSVLTDMYIDKLSNPRDCGGWLLPQAQAEMDAIPEEQIMRYAALREIRNFLVHDSVEARNRLKLRLDELAVLDPRFDIKQQLTARVLMVWLQGADHRRLRLLLDAVPAIWRSMVVAESVSNG